MNIVQHLSESNEHYTPVEIVNAARRVFGGGIDLDPASCEYANRGIGATTIFTKADNGLALNWYGKVFVNPPGGSLKVSKNERDDEDLAAYKVAARKRFDTSSHAVAWWRKLQEEGEAGRVEEAIFVGFTLEILCTSQGNPRWPSVPQFPCCFVKDRLNFTASSGDVGKFPTHSNVIAYCGPNAAVFREEFGKFGIVR